MLRVSKSYGARASATGGQTINAESVSRIDAFIVSAVYELFASYGMPLEAVEFKEKEIGDPFASSIGFTSDRLLGVLVLTASRAVAERSLPSTLRTSQVEDAMIADWTGELSNQLLGHLKKRFYAVGIDIALSTPTVFAGTGLRHFSRQSPLLRRLLFKGGGALLVEFQADFGPDFEIGEEEKRQEPPLPEGEALFF